MSAPSLGSTMRADRLLTLSLFAPWQRLLTRSSSEAIPILMYHSVDPELDDSVHPYFRTVTSPRAFAAQVECLRNSSYQAITLTDALALLASKSTPAARLTDKVVITFDDGFRDFHSHAFPVLERAGFRATVFLASTFIGRTFITGRECLGPQEIRELCDAGVEFGSHSATHRRLVELPMPELAAELSGSKATIEDVTGREVSLFSYPFRFPEEDTAFTTRLAGLLDESGYRGGVTTAIGRSTERDDPRFLPRLPMNDCDDALLLSAKLAGHYDWLRAGQRLRKHSRALWRRWSRR